MDSSTWTRGVVNGIVGYVHDTSRAVIVAGIDGGWTLDRDVTADTDLEHYDTLGEAMQAAA